MKKIILAGALLLFAGTSFAAQTHAPSPCVSDECFDTSTRISGQNAPLRGNALFRYLGFRLYTVALYTVAPTAWKAELALGEVPKRLIIRYSRLIKKEQIIAAAEKNLKSNPKVSWERISPRVQQLNKYYENVKKGDEYTLTYIPGKGTSLELNGSQKTTIPGEDFARAYFGIWLSESSINERLRLQLLGSQQHER